MDGLNTKYMQSEQGDGNPETWDLATLNGVAVLMNRADDAKRDIGRWTYPERPSWLQDGELGKTHEMKWLDEEDQCW